SWCCRTTAARIAVRSGFVARRCATATAGVTASAASSTTRTRVRRIGRQRLPSPRVTWCRGAHERLGELTGPPDLAFELDRLAAAWRDDQHATETEALGLDRLDLVQ